MLFEWETARITSTDLSGLCYQPGGHHMALCWRILPRLHLWQKQFKATACNYDYASALNIVCWQFPKLVSLIYAWRTRGQCAVLRAEVYNFAAMQQHWSHVQPCTTRNHEDQLNILKPEDHQNIISQSEFVFKIIHNASALQRLIGYCCWIKNRCLFWELYETQTLEAEILNVKVGGIYRCHSALKRAGTAQLV
jgi:hypothetical protein